MKTGKFVPIIVLLLVLSALALYFIPVASFTEATCFVYEKEKKIYSIHKGERPEYDKHKAANDQFERTWDGLEPNQGICAMPTLVRLYVFR